MIFIHPWWNMRFTRLKAGFLIQPFTRFATKIVTSIKNSSMIKIRGHPLVAAPFF